MSLNNACLFTLLLLCLGILGAHACCRSSSNYDEKSCVNSETSSNGETSNGGTSSGSTSSGSTSSGSTSSGNNSSSTTTNNDTCVNNNSTSTSNSDTTNACCVCGEEINLMIVVNNQIQEPTWEAFNTTVRNYKQPVLKQLEVAANMDQRFKFSADYFANLGYFVTTINNVVAPYGTYWEITTKSNNSGLFASADVGVSLLVPQDGDIIMFNLTSW